MKQYELYAVVMQPREPIADFTLSIEASSDEEMAAAVEHFQTQNPDIEVQRVVNIA